MTVQTSKIRRSILLKIMHSSLQNIRLPIYQSCLWSWWRGLSKTVSRKHKILVIAADERYLPTDNGNCSRPVTIRLKRCCRCIISICRFRIRSGDHFRSDDQVWIRAMPHKDEKVMPFFEQHKSLSAIRRNSRMLSPASTLTANISNLCSWWSWRTYWFTRKPGLAAALQWAIKNDRFVISLCHARRLFWRFATAITHWMVIPLRIPRRRRQTNARDRLYAGSFTWYFGEELKKMGMKIINDDSPGEYIRTVNFSPATVLSQRCVG